MDRRPAHHCHGQVRTITEPSGARRTDRRRRHGHSAVRASALDTAALGLPLRQAQLGARRSIRRRVHVHVLRQDGPIYDWHVVLGGPGWSASDESQSAAGLKA
eukprot:7381354-Prymnesium_polylepis.2